MTIDDAREALDAIATGPYDPVIMHVQEDDLRREILEEIARTTEETVTQGLAEVALSTKFIEFPRW